MDKRVETFLASFKTESSFITYCLEHNLVGQPYSINDCLVAVAIDHATGVHEPIILGETGYHFQGYPLPILFHHIIGSFDRSRLSPELYLAEKDGS